MAIDFQLGSYFTASIDVLDNRRNGPHSDPQAITCATAQTPGNRFAYAAEHGHITIVDPSTTETFFESSPGFQATSMTCSADGVYLDISFNPIAESESGGEEHGRRYRWSDGSLVGERNSFSGPLAASKSSDSIAVSMWGDLQSDVAIGTWRDRSFQIQVGPKDVLPDLAHIEWSLRGDFIVLAGGNDWYWLDIRDSQTLEPVTQIIEVGEYQAEYSTLPPSASFSADGKTLLNAGVDGSVQYRRPDTGEILDSTQARPAMITAFAAHPTESATLVAYADGVVLLADQQAK